MIWLPGVLSQGGKKYVWERYAIAYGEVAGTAATVSRTYSYSKYASTAYTIQNGVFVLTNPVATTFENLTADKRTVDIADSTNAVSSGGTLYKVTSNALVYDAVDSGSSESYKETLSQSKSGLILSSITATASGFTATMPTFSTQVSNIGTGVFYSNQKSVFTNNFSGVQSSLYKITITSRTSDDSTTPPRWTFTGKCQKIVSGKSKSTIGYTPYTLETTKGELLGTVKSNDPTAYPENGIQDGYWYVRQVLPGQVNFVGYIQSSGTQHIDTSFVPNQDTRVVCEVEFAPEDSTSQYLFGARTSSTANQYAIRGIVDLYQGRYNTEEVSAVSATINGAFVIDFNKNIITINGETTTQTYEQFECPGNMYLFAVNNNGTVYANATAKLYYMKIYDNGTLVRDYWPCLDPSGVACLYDKVNGEYVYNAGSGIFTYG